MATSSFDKTFVVNDQRAVKELKQELDKERKTFNKPSADYINKRKRGEESLKRILSL